MFVVSIGSSSSLLNLSSFFEKKTIKIHQIESNQLFAGNWLNRWTDFYEIDAKRRFERRKRRHWSHLTQNRAYISWNFPQNIVYDFPQNRKLQLFWVPFDYRFFKMTCHLVIQRGVKIWSYLWNNAMIVWLPENRPSDIIAREVYWNPGNNSPPLSELAKTGLRWFHIPRV